MPKGQPDDLESELVDQVFKGDVLIEVEQKIYFAILTIINFFGPALLLDYALEIDELLGQCRPMEHEAE